MVSEDCDSGVCSWIGSNFMCVECATNSDCTGSSAGDHCVVDAAFVQPSVCGCATDGDCPLGSCSLASSTCTSEVTVVRPIDPEVNPINPEVIDTEVNPINPEVNARGDPHCKYQSNILNTFRVGGSHSFSTLNSTRSQNMEE